MEPWGRATSGSSAQRALANTLKRPVLNNTDCTAGAPRRYLNPAPSALKIRRAGTGAGFGRFFQRYKKKMTPKKLAALSRNAYPDPAAAITNPPNTGPIARATLNPAESSATADLNSPSDTTCGVIACHAGSFMMAPKPSRKVKNSRVQGVTRPRIVSTPSAADA